MERLAKDQIETAAKLVYTQLAPSPQIIWPQICHRAGTTVWVKHENHLPTGSFKVRGGITFMDWLKKYHPEKEGIVTATRGNHGQSQARAATAANLKAKILAPFGNAKEKNSAMRAYGAELIEYGNDFDEARVEAERLAELENLQLVPPFHRELVRGVSTYALELFNHVSDLDTVYVPIGCGSGICSVIGVRDMLNLKTKIVGVVPDNAQCVKLSYESKRPISTNSANTFADGAAVRVPVPEALEIYQKGAERIVSVSEDEIAEAIRIYFQDTHNLAEGAGALALAAMFKEKDRLSNQNVAIILSGSNVDTNIFMEILSGKTPNHS